MTGRLAYSYTFWVLGVLLITFVPKNSSVAADDNRAWRLAAREPDANHWRSTLSITNPLTGKVQQRESGYVEVATGANFFNEAKGEYEPAREEWEVFADGIVAQYGRHKVILARNINQGGAVDLLTSDGVRLLATPTGIGIYDPDDGKQLLIGEIRDAAAERGATPSEIYFRDCFVGVRASVRFTFRRSGFSQEILLEQKITLPPGFSERSRLECYTEFANGTPAPRQTSRALRKEQEPAVRLKMVEPDMIDTSLDFGETKIRLGKCFLTGAESRRQRIPVAKQWINANDRPVLIEAVEFRAIEPMLGQLQAAVQPLQHPVLVRERQTRRAQDQAQFWQPKDLQAKFQQRLATVLASRKQLPQVAKLEGGPQALVVDYESVSSTANMVFQGDTTYYCSDSVYLTGVTRLEGGAVIKFATASITVEGEIQCLTSVDAPAFFTSKNDDTVGQSLPGSTGNPVPASNFVTYLDFPNGSGTDLKHLHMRFADFGLWYDICGDNSNILTHATFYRCRTAIWSDSCYFTARNILIYDADEAVMGYVFNGSIEHLTLDKASKLMDASSGPSTLGITNSILCRMTNWGTVFGDTLNSNVVVVTTNTAIFETLGGGAHYLSEIAGGPLRNAGTTNVSILSELSERTTYPPVVKTNKVSGYFELGRAVPRDDDGQPDLGYAYPAVDWAVNTLAITNGTLMITNGATVAVFGPFGFWLQDNSKLISAGTPLQPNRIVRYYAVQEQATNWAVTLPSSPYTIAPAIFGNAAPSAFFRFTRLSIPAGGGVHLEINTPDWTLVDLQMRDCEVRGGTLNLYENTETNLTCAFTNNLFERCTTWNYPYGNRYFYNNLFTGGSLSLLRFGGTWVFKDNVFSECALDDGTQDLTHSHNGYNKMLSRLMPTNSSDVVLTNFVFQSGPLGLWYQYSSNFYEKGSRGASNVGLYHFTCRTNQQKAGTNIVSLGYHYVAMNGALLVDSDGDLASDWLEDRDGNGAVDAGESDWRSGHTDTDGDGVDDYVELLQGRNPRAPVSNDTNGVVNLKVYTPLR